MSTNLCRFWFFVHQIISNQRQRQRHEAISNHSYKPRGGLPFKKERVPVLPLGVKEALLAPLKVLSLKMSTARALDVPWARKKYDKRDVLF